MHQNVPFSILEWGTFLCVISVFLALDLGVFHKKAHVIKFREALCWIICWVSMAGLFAFWIKYRADTQKAFEFVTGYVIELSLSMDNVFVIAVIFSYFKTPINLQHRVLFWGILGAIIMRGFMICLGTALVRAFEWVFIIFGIFLIISGVKLLISRSEGVHPEKNLLIRLARKIFPVTKDYVGQEFFCRVVDGFAVTPLFLVLLVIETADLVFALDSIPAVFAVTTDPFIVFTSNVFAILGLRSLYFLLANAIEYFQYLKYGLSLVLIFVGFKMLLAEKYHISTQASLLIILSILLVSIIVSVIRKRKNVVFDNEIK
jgi:tellurite resistance protein TerC